MQAWQDVLNVKPPKTRALMRQFSLNIPRSSAEQEAVISQARHRWDHYHLKWRLLKQRDSVLVEAVLGNGFLGLELIVHSRLRKVVVRSYAPPNNESKDLLQLPLGGSIRRGMVVMAINGIDVSEQPPEDVLALLQSSTRPCVVVFAKCSTSMVVCRLCECRVDIHSLDEHTEYCVMSQKNELEADAFNACLHRIARSIEANMMTESMRSYFSTEDIQLYNAMRVIALQTAACDITSIESFELCSRFVKMLDQVRIRHTNQPSASCVVERGLKYCSKIRGLVHAKMSQMRTTQKFLLQQQHVHLHRPILPTASVSGSAAVAADGAAPVAVAPHSASPFYRTKSLEEREDPASVVVPAAAAVALPLKPGRTTTRISIRDFDIIKPISKGAFGKVYLAQKKTTGDQFAIKILAKEHVLRKKQIAHIETERDILASVESPFVVKLYWTFQSKSNLFLVMEYLPGGDFMSLLECIVRLEEKVARIYIAEIALALNHLHSKGCVHRDLKPDNILIGSNGHIKLTDFGLSEEGASLSEVDEKGSPPQPISSPRFTHSRTATITPADGSAVEVAMTASTTAASRMTSTSTTSSNESVINEEAVNDLNEMFFCEDDPFPHHPRAQLQAPEVPEVPVSAPLPMPPAAPTPVPSPVVLSAAAAAAAASMAAAVAAEAGPGRGGTMRSEFMQAFSGNGTGPQEQNDPEETSTAASGEPKNMRRRRPVRRTTSKAAAAASASFSRCGTPDYLSPEIIVGTAHGPPVDYWALGVILYEMLVGFPPFNDDSVESIFGNILARRLIYPDEDQQLSHEVIDLMNRLLELDPDRRITWHELVRHPFFDGIDWDTLLDTTPPFVPTLDDPNDTSYFNNRNLTEVFIDDEDFDLSETLVETCGSDSTFTANTLSTSMTNLPPIHMTTQPTHMNVAVSSSTTSTSAVWPDDMVAHAMELLGLGNDVQPASPPAHRPTCTSENNTESNNQHTAATPIPIPIPTNTHMGTTSLRISTADVDLIPQPPTLSEDENENMAFGGSPSSLHLSSTPQAFRTFSFTNTSALAAASRQKASEQTQTNAESAAVDLEDGASTTQIYWL